MEVHKGLSSDSRFFSAWYLSHKAYVFSSSSTPQKLSKQLGHCSFTLATSNKTNGI